MDEELNKAQIDAISNGFSLIDGSNLDDDFLFASSSDVSAVDNPSFAEEVPMNQPSDSLGLHKPKKTGKCNLRNSLAWDSAFFTNAGVLDAEELSSIIEGAETGVKQSSFLPVIQEDLSKSTDSISTFQSDLTLESLEADLFCDIRASIQRCSKSSTIGKSLESKIQGVVKSVNGSSTKLADPSTRRLAKPKSASNRLNSGQQGSMRTIKPSPVSRQEKPPVNRSKESCSLLSRLSKAAGQSNLQVPATPKRMSFSTSRAKQDTNAVGIVKGAGKGSSLPPHQVNTNRPLPKTLAASKISAPSLVLNKTGPRSSRSSCDSSSSSTSENVKKSQTGVIRRKTEKTVNLPSLSKTQTSTKLVAKAKSQSKESRLSAFVKSSSSPSVSPASSISEWSIDSSSSTATVSQKHLRSNSSPSSQDVVFDSNGSRNVHSLSNEGALSGHDHQVVGVNNQSMKQPSTGDVFNARPGLAKPSGLRMPSPTIGFFDGVKVGVRSSNSSSRSRTAVSSSLPRPLAGTHSSSGAGTINKSKPGTSASLTAKPKPKITDSNSITPPLPVNHSIDSNNSSCSEQTDNDTQTSSEFHTNTPQVSRLDMHVPESLLVGEDYLGCDLVGENISSKSALENDNKIPESSDPENIVLDSELVGKNMDIEDPPKYNFLSDSSKLAIENVSMSALVKVDEVTEKLEGEQALDLASLVKDNLVSSYKETKAEENSLISTDMENSISKYELGADSQSADPNLMLTVKTAENSENAHENLSKSTLQNSDMKVTEIADVEKFSNQGKDELLHSIVCVEISHATPISSTDEKNLSIANNISDVTPQVNEADNHGSVGQHILPDEDRHVEPCANDENQSVENGVEEIKGKSYTANYDGGVQEETKAEGNSLISTDMENSISKYELEADIQNADPNLMLTVKTAENSEITHKNLSKITLQNSDMKVTEIADVGKYSNQGKDELLHSIVCVEISHAIPISNAEEKNLSIANDISDVTPQVNDADNHGRVDQHILPVEDRNVEPCANDENQFVENGVEEIKEKSCTANYDGGVQEESHLSVQSLAEKFSTLILNSPLPSSMADPSARTSFAIKNSELNVPFPSL